MMGLVGIVVHLHFDKLILIIINRNIEDTIYLINTITLTLFIFYKLLMTKEDLEFKLLKFLA